MYKEVLSEIQNISIYPVFSFTVFFVFFSLVTYWVVRSKKEDFEELRNMPLSDHSHSDL